MDDDEDEEFKETKENEDGISPLSFIPSYPSSPHPTEISIEEFREDRAVQIKKQELQSLFCDENGVRGWNTYTTYSCIHQNQNCSLTFIFFSL